MFVAEQGLVRGLVRADSLPYDLLDLLNMVLIRIPLPGPEKASEAIPAPPGNDVDVEVGDALTSVSQSGESPNVPSKAYWCGVPLCAEGSLLEV